MAQVHKRNGRWRVRWYEPNGDRKSKTFDRKVDADAWVTKVSHDVLTGSYVSPAAGRTTFKVYAEEWRRSKAHRPTTAAQVESHFRNHVYPAIGDMPIARIRPSDIQAMVDGLTLGATAAETVYAYVANVFKRAVRDRLVSSSPCVEIELPAKSDAPLEFLTTQQVQAAAEHIDERHEVFVWIAAGAGMRPSEITGLRVDRVDFLRRTIKVDAQLITLTGDRPRLGPPKTSASYRTVPVGSTVTDAIAAHLAKFGPGPQGLVMSTRLRNPVRRGRLNESWRATRAPAKLPSWSTPHDLRHYYASLLIHQGLDVKTVQRRLGHLHSSTTLDTYTHLWPDTEDHTRDAVDLELGGRRAPGGPRQKQTGRSAQG